MEVILAQFAHQEIRSLQPSGRFNFITLALMLATTLSSLSTAATRHQDDPFTSDGVVAPGNPPLTESMITRFTNFQGWLFEIPLTQQQRERIRAMLLRDWKKPQEIRNNMTWLALAANLAKGTPDEREFAIAICNPAPSRICEPTKTIQTPSGG